MSLFSLSQRKITVDRYIHKQWMYMLHLLVQGSLTPCKGSACGEDISLAITISWIEKLLNCNRPETRPSNKTRDSDRIF